MHPFSISAILFAAAATLTTVVPLTTNHKPSFGGPPDSMVVSRASSTIRWYGASIAGAPRATGTVRIRDGLLVTRHQQLEAGSFTIAMSSLVGDGLTKFAVVRTLAGPAWFDVVRFPTAQFVATSFVLVHGATYRVDGTLTLHGVSKPTSFSADVTWPETGHAVVRGTLAIDRRDWNVGPASGGTEMHVDMRIDLHRKALIVGWLSAKH